MSIQPFKESVTTYEQWEAYRKVAQSRRKKTSPKGVKTRKYPIFSAACHVASLFMKLTGEERWVKGAMSLQKERHTFEFSDLPKPFNGYRILQISDAHFDSLPGIEREIARQVQDEAVDLCIFTGDYRDSTRITFDQLKPAFEHVLKHVKARDGFVAVLGNHDCYSARSVLSALGINVLVNESVKVERDGQRIVLTGVDDVFYFYTPWAKRAISEKIDGFKIALVHSPDFCDLSADHHYNLYLTGHTHGGQVCLPMPIITHGVKRYLASGRWILRGMQGYTNRGAGVSRLPLRINCPGEVAFISLKIKS